MQKRVTSFYIIKIINCTAKTKTNYSFSSFSLYKYVNGVKEGSFKIELQLWKNVKITHHIIVYVFNPSKNSNTSFVHNKLRVKPVHKAFVNNT